jgi:hypothetical protein
MAQAKEKPEQKAIKIELEKSAGKVPLKKGKSPKEVSKKINA